MKRLCVFTGSYPGARPGYLAAVQELAREFVARDWALVYGGSKLGLMGAMADAVLALGGHAILMERLYPMPPRIAGSGDRGIVKRG